MRNPAGTLRTVHFGPFEVDFRAGEFLKEGRRIRLQDQPLQILAMLLERPGEVVTREELREKLWPGNTFVDFDNGLNNAILRLREALGDFAKSPRFIETLPRRGYRFIAPVDLEPLPTVPATSEQSQNSQIETAAEPPAGAPAGPRWRALWIALGTTTLAAALWFGMAGLDRNGWFMRGAHAMRIRSLAVLPLENLTGDPRQDDAVDGMTDALTTTLAQMGGPGVISRTSAMHYKAAKKPLPEIVRDLHVDAVVEGAVTQSNGRIHVTAQLIDAPSDHHLWARAYEGNPATLEGLTFEIASDLAHEMGVSIKPETAAYLSRARSRNGEAYDDYLRATPYFGLEKPTANEAAIRLLERSVALDPDFAAGWAALATAYRVRAFGIAPAEKEWGEKAAAAVEKALALDPNLADAYVARGSLLSSTANHFAYERAVADFRHALALNPNLAQAHHQLANVYNHVGLLEKAEQEIQQAVALDPLNTGVRFRIGVNLLYRGRYEESLAAIRDSKDFYPALWVFQTSYALFQLGRREEAKQRVDEFLRQNATDPGGTLTGMEALFAAAAGKRDSAEKAIERAVAQGRGFDPFHHTAFVIASAYALLNQPESALHYLRFSAEEGFPCYPLFERDPNLNNLRHDPKFMEFMAEQKKQWEHLQAYL